MKINDKLIERILKRIKKGDEAKSHKLIADAIAIYQEIDTRRQHLIQQIREEKERHHKTNQKISQEMQKNQKNCDHPLVSEYHEGEDNSWSECDICGAEIEERSNQAPGYDG